MIHSVFSVSSIGAVAILPTLLYLATGVIRETAVRTDNENTKPGAEAPVHAALHCVKSLTNNKYARDHRSQEQWTGLLQSALAKIIDLAKTGMLQFYFLLKEQYKHYNILDVLIYKILGIKTKYRCILYSLYRNIKVRYLL